MQNIDLESQHIDLESQRTASTDTDHVDARPEERWHGSLEQLARQYRDVSAVASEEHDRSGYGARQKHIIFGLPGPLISLVVASVAALWQDPDSIYLIVPLSTLGAIFGAVHTFFDYGGKASSHWNYASQYGGNLQQNRRLPRARHNLPHPPGRLLRRGAHRVRSP